MDCNKKQYDTKRDATSALNLFRRGQIYLYGNKRRKIKKRPCRIYYCKECEAWHITSQRYNQDED